MNVMIDRAHIWKVIYNARSNKSHPPTSPNTAPATQNESHDWSASHMKSHLQCAKQQESSSNFTKYCACHAKWISWLTVLTYGRSFTMRGATRVILQLHQILRLPRKMNLMIDPHHIWNVIYNARSNKSHPPTSPNTAPATQNESHDWSASHMKRHLQCAEQQESSSNFTKYCACHAKWISWLILRLPRKMNLMIDPHHIWKVIYNARSNKSHPPTSANTAPATQNESHDWPCLHMEGHLQCAEQQESSSNFSKYCACRLPHKMNLMIDPHHIWNVIYNARSNKSHPPNSPNTAPATQNESHDWSASHMKRHLQCAEQLVSSSNLTKYCACHEKWISCWILFTHETLFTMRGATYVTLQPHQILRLPRKMTFQNLRQICWKRLKCHFQCAIDPTMIREWSDHDPTMKTQTDNPPRRRGYFSRSPEADSIENYNVSRSGYHSTFHQMLRLPQKVTHELHQMLRLPQKVTHELHQMLRLP